ncbi:Unknown protein sequence [Pseudomonas syringae pv. spinaceae]|uniref:Uncharacterized protein n=1 Tax=Pseudomonas syringae pv. spinaceae TaxID=264459 RepID=A0A0Q0CTU6_PSESX|nr:Unknown protein sequence [Pseudomonas syringae pv. spinaceae]
MCDYGVLVLIVRWDTDVEVKASGDCILVGFSQKHILSKLRSLLLESLPNVSSANEL